MLSLSSCTQACGTSRLPCSLDLIRVLIVVAETNGLMERLVDIVVLPDLRRGLHDGLQAHLVTFVLQVLQGDRIGCDRSKIALGAHEHDRRVLADLADLGAPALHTVQTDLVVDCDAEHEAVRLVVADLTIHTKVRIATIVVDLKLDLFALELFRPAEDIKYVWLVSLIEDLLLVIND